MYTQIWAKYLPLLRIFLKRAAAGEQVLSLNQSDFDRSGKGSKAAYVFAVDFINGMVANATKDTEMARAFIGAVKEDEIIRCLMAANNYAFSFTTKFQLRIKSVVKPVLVEAE